MERSKTTLDLGTLTGDLLVFGGIYSNLQALEAMQQIAARLDISADRTICTGDLIGYCAQPKECLELVREWGVHSIAGNVEIQLREDSDYCGCNFEEGSRCAGFSATWYPYAKYHVPESWLGWLNGLPDFIRFQYGKHRFGVVHGSFFETSEFVFRSQPWSVKASNLEAMEVDAILAGHCGLPFSESEGGRHWLNPGVIGMPANDGTPRVWYMVLREHPELGFTARHRSFGYDHATAAELMRQNYLPEEYARTLETGLWDNCEILPEVETAAAGVRLGWR